MKLKFKINKYYLAGYAILSLNKPFVAWQNFEEKIWQKNKEKPAYYFLNSKYINWALEKIQLDILDKNVKSVLLKQSTDLKEIYQEIFKSKEFQKLYRETKNYLIFVEKQWRKNENQVLKLLEEISGLSLPKQTITVYITHPKSCNGKTIDKNTIVFGHKEDWKNYSTIYIAHELMHVMTWPGHFEPDYDILHALICLTTNNELRIRLNRRGGYFKENNKWTEYPIIISVEKNILPYWKKYLLGKFANNILELKSFLIKKRKGLL